MEGPISDARSYLGVRVYVLTLVISACAGDDAAPSAGPDAGGPGGATQSSGSAGPAAAATAACIDACDHQIDVGCSGTTEIYRPFCVGGCERTTQQTLPDCVDELLALQRCRAALRWECDGFGGSQPTSTCAAESGACLQCMDGTLCDALASGLGGRGP